MMTITKCVRDDNCSKINGECNKTKQWESNLAAVWGQMATGGGHATLRGGSRGRDIRAKAPPPPPPLLKNNLAHA